MRTLLLFLTLVLLTTTNLYSKETIDCKSLKKFSIQYSICKTKVALSGKVTNSSKKNKGNIKSIWKKLGESKSLSDVIK